MLHWLLSNAVATLPFVLALLIAQRLITARPGVWNALWVIALVRLILPPVVDWPWSLSLPDAQPVVEKIVERDEMLFQKAWMLATLPDDVVAVAGEPLPLPAPKAAFSWVKLLLAAWAVGAFALLVRAWLGVRRFHRIAREGIPADTLLNDEVEVVAGRLRCRKPGVRVLAGILSPLVWALGKPTLYWPFGLEYRLNETGRRAVLTHELAHVKRRDHWVRRLEMFTALLHWWNPLFWIIRAQVRRTGELACDWWVVQTQPNQRRAYAEALLEVCRGWSPGSAPAVGIGTGGVKELERRLTMIMRSTGSQKRGKRAAIAVGLLGALALPGWSWGKPDDGKNFEVELALVEGQEKAAGEAEQLFTLFRRFESADGAFEVVVGDDKSAVPIKNNVQNGLKWLVTQNKDATAKWEELATARQELLAKIKLAEAELKKFDTHLSGMDARTRLGTEAKALATKSTEVGMLVDLLKNKLGQIDDELKNQKATVMKWNAAIMGADPAKSQNINDAIKSVKLQLEEKLTILGKDHPEVFALEGQIDKLVELEHSQPKVSTGNALRGWLGSLGEAKPVAKESLAQYEKAIKAQAEAGAAQEAYLKSLFADRRAQVAEKEKLAVVQAQQEMLVKAKAYFDAARGADAKAKAEMDAAVKKFQATLDLARLEAAKAQREAEMAKGKVLKVFPKEDSADPVDAPKQGSFKIETRLVGPDAKVIKNVQGTQGPIKVEGKVITLDGKELKPGDGVHGTIKVEGKLLTTDGKAPGKDDRILLWNAAPGHTQHGNTMTLSSKIDDASKTGESKMITITVDDKGNVLRSNVAGQPMAGPKTGELNTITITVDGKGNVPQSNVTGQPLGVALTEGKPLNVQGGLFALDNLAQAPQVKDVLIERVTPLTGRIAVEGKPLDTMTFREVKIPLSDSIVQPLERGTYKLPGKAEAVAKFIKENVKGKGIEIKADKDTFTVTADPATQRIIGQFLSLLNPKISQAKPAALAPTSALFAPAAPAMPLDAKSLGVTERVGTMTVPAVPGVASVPAVPAAPAAPARVKVEAARAATTVADKPIRIEMKLTDPTKPPVPPTAAKPTTSSTAPAQVKPAAESPKPTPAATKPAVNTNVETYTNVVVISAGKIKDNAEQIEKLLKDGFTMKMEKNGDLRMEKTTKTTK